MGVSIADGVVAVAPKTIIAGTNITTSETDSTITINASGGGSGSANVGSIPIVFGAAPGTNVVSVDVIGQTTIIPTSKVKAYLMTDTTATHNAYEHMMVPLNITCGNIVNNVGFTIYVTTDLRLSGTFNLQWEWV